MLRLTYLPSAVPTGVCIGGTSMTRTLRPSSSTMSTRHVIDGRVRLAMRAWTRRGSVNPPSCRGRIPVTRPSSSTPTRSHPGSSPGRLARQTTASTSSRSESCPRSSPLNSTAAVSPPMMRARNRSLVMSASREVALMRSGLPGVARALLFCSNAISQATRPLCMPDLLHLGAGAAPQPAFRIAGPGRRPAPGGCATRRRRRECPDRSVRRRSR